jgi:molybdate transport system substrate-binding protein
MQRLLRHVILYCLIASGSLSAAEIQVLSCSTMASGLEAAAQGFRSASSHGVDIAYASPPQIQERLSTAETPGLVIASLPVLEGLARAGRLNGRPVPLGRVGIGMATRPGPPLPAVTDADGLRRAVTRAPTLVFNRASTGVYLDEMFERLGLASIVAPKALRFPTMAGVFEYLLRGSGEEIGFAMITDIRMDRDLRYLGPLPPEVQSYTTYGAALMPGAPVAAEALLRWLTGPEARDAFERAGIEAVPQ